MNLQVAKLIDYYISKIIELTIDMQNCKTDLAKELIFQEINKFKNSIIELKKSL